MHALLMIITVSSCVLGNSIKNVFAKKNLKNQSDNLIYNLMTNAVCIVIMALFGGIREVHGTTVFLSAVFGFACLLSGLTCITALKLGPMSLTSLLMLSGSMLSSTVVNTIVFKEGMPTAVKLVGVVLILISMVLASNIKEEKNITPLWIVAVLAAAATNGSLGIIQKIQANSAYPAEQMQFLFWTFVFSTLFNMIWFGLNTKVKKEPVTVTVNRKLAGSALINGTTTAAQHVINLKLVSELPSAVFFPICSGSRILLTGLVDIVIFKTKLSVRQAVSFVLGFIAIMMLAGVFG